MSPSPKARTKATLGEEKPSLVWPGLLRMAGQIPGSASSSVPSCISAARCMCGAVASGPSRGEPSPPRRSCRVGIGRRLAHTRGTAACPWPVCVPVRAAKSFPVIVGLIQADYRQTQVGRERGHRSCVCNVMCCRTARLQYPPAADVSVICFLGSLAGTDRAGRAVSQTGSTWAASS